LEPFFTVDRVGPAPDEIDRKVTQFVRRVENRMLADIPSWQHWFEQDLFAVLQRWRSTSIGERYAL